jgi:hypothetical protein
MWARRQKRRKPTSLRVRNCAVVDGLDTDDIFSVEFDKYETPVGCPADATPPVKDTS